MNKSKNILYLLSLVFYKMIQLSTNNKNTIKNHYFEYCLKDIKTC